MTTRAPQAALVDALRADGAHVPELCLRRPIDGDAVVGHILFSRARLASGHEVLALAPMAVLPEHQRVRGRLAARRGGGAACARRRETDFRGSRPSRRLERHRFERTPSL